MWQVSFLYHKMQDSSKNGVLDYLAKFILSDICTNGSNTYV